MRIVAHSSHLRRLQCHENDGTFLVSLALRPCRSSLRPRVGLRPAPILSGDRKELLNGKLPDNSHYLPDNYRITSPRKPHLTHVISETYDFFYRNRARKNSFLIARSNRLQVKPPVPPS